MTRSDLSPGLQAAQSCHALRLFGDEHPALERSWFRTSNRLVLVGIEGEPALRCLLAQARDAGVCASAFVEPDLDDALTSIALQPGAKASRLCRRLPLLLGRGG